MALKTRLLENEKIGLTPDEILLAEKYVRKHKTAAAIPETESGRLYELVLMGYSFFEIHQSYPQYDLGQIILTSAIRGWTRDRERLQGSVRERVQARVIQSVVDQVDLLTSMMSVANVEHMEAMRAYIMDPKNNPKPDLRIQSIKDLKEISETLQKLVSGSSSANKASIGARALDAPHTKTHLIEDGGSKKKKKSKKDEDDIANIIAGELAD